MAARAPRGQLRPLSIAPMMQRTDRHFRRLLREITRCSLLYTEMVVTGAVLHGNRERLLGSHPCEHPIALQLGGSDPDEVRQAARIGAEWGYDEINLNIGCPSSRVQAGRFGACLMLESERVAECVRAARAAVDLPVTIKQRIGVDAQDGYEDMLRFVDIVAAAGADRFSVHARKAWLQGLSPRENRNIPPLRYEDVYRLKRERPELSIELNGGVLDLQSAAEHLRQVDAVMIGRAAYARPMGLAEADAHLFGQTPRPRPSVRQVVEGYLPYVEQRLRAGDRLIHMSRHMVNLYAGRPGARAWKRTLSEHPRGGTDILKLALDRAEEVAERTRATRQQPLRHAAG